MHEGISHHQDQDRKKMKSSSEAPQVSGEIGGEAEEPSGFEIGADRVGVNPRQEALEIQIKEKEKVREGLMKSWKAKFDAIKTTKAESDRKKELITRLHLNEKLSKEDYEAEIASMRETLDGDMRDAQKDLDLATEYREEIERLKSELEEGTN